MFMRNAGLSRWIALALSGVVIMTACSSAPPTPTSREIVLDALSTPAELLADTVRFGYAHLREHGDGFVTEYEITGITDFANRRALARQSFGHSQRLDVHVYTVDDYEYSRSVDSPRWERDWAKSGDDTIAQAPMLGRYQLGGWRPAYALDPEARRLILDAAILSVETGEESSLYGNRVSHFSVIVEEDVEVIKSKLPASLSAEFDLTNEHYYLTSSDVWIDKKGRLIRLRDHATGAPASVVRQQDWWGFGDVPSVQPPSGVDDVGGDTLFRITTTHRDSGEVDTDRFSMRPGDPGRSFHTTPFYDDGTFGIYTYEGRPGAPDQVFRSMTVRMPEQRSTPLSLQLDRRLGSKEPGFGYHERIGGEFRVEGGMRWPRERVNDDYRAGYRRIAPSGFPRGVRG